MDSPIIEVAVGKHEDAKTYYLHRSLLCEVSDFFKKCLEQGFTESASRKVALPEDCPDTFAWFVKWAYSGDLAPLGITFGCDAIFFMTKLYVLADKLLCEDLKNRTMDMVQEACSVSILYASDVTQAMQQGPTETKMIQYLVKQLAYGVRKNNSSVNFYKEFCNDPSEWQTFFKLDVQLTQNFMSIVTSPEIEKSLSEDPASVEGCGWHEHSSPRKEPCKRWPDRVQDFQDQR